MNSTPHTSHFLVFHSTHFNVTLTLAQVWCVSRTSFHPILMRSSCGCLDTLYDSPFHSLLAIFSLISFFFHFPVLHLLLPCGEQVPCAHSRMRTLAPLPGTILSQGAFRHLDLHVPEMGYRSAQDLIFTPSFSQAPGSFSADGGTVG